MSTEETNTSNDRKSSHGRKGDSRMHKAVAARMANPEMSLFEALRIGGFHYPSNEDATAVDAENVTLGQRKNQLSRRLRLARKNNRPRGDNPVYDSMAAAGSPNAGGTAASLSLNAQRELQKLMHQFGPQGAATSAIAARALQMKREHAVLGDISDEDGNADQDFAHEEVAKRPRIAKFHPDFAPLIVPTARTATLPQRLTDASSVASGSVGAATQGSGLHVGLGASSAASLPVASLFGSQSQPRASSVAISSLSQSAQAVGMTLEQLAVSLASNTTSLAKVLAEDSAADAASKKMALALKLFENEAKTVYSKCMLMAGMDPLDCQSTSQVFQDFALKAWENEGKRLKASLGHSRDNTDFSVENGGKSGSQSSLSSGRSMGHSHHHHRNHDHADGSRGCDSRHIHRLDGLCGHKAIIHKPKDGQAHIDFVVGDKVECYQDVEPLEGTNLEAAWLSRYKCKESGDHVHCGGNKGKDVPDSSIPKVIELSDINLQDPEWNYDVTGSIDGGVAGLFKLGARSDEVAT